ncbi:Hypothetical protein BQ3484_386 [Cedratvirus A11]|uniref:Uncharacterized protein n=1 Tax=Cedratvirus A11 TaxID=1903266 RepID=A0A1M7XUS0_9VIRU|nr:Hypothetical protein BQ3484_386 [Cedratvirus A11]SHO33454.1 Hypothetical protein BQ3484_386 [Cedratvirus A11]
MNPYTTTYTTLMGYSVTTNGERCMVAAPNGQQDTSYCSNQGYCPAFNTAFPCSSAAYAPYVRDTPPGGILVPPEGITVPIGGGDTLPPGGILVPPGGITIPIGGTFPPANGGAGTIPFNPGNTVLRF